MILQTLNEYYERSSDLAPEGWERKRIPFLIELRKDGTFVQLTDLRSGKKPSDIPASLVPKSEIRSGTRAHERPNALWDHVGFVLGHAKSADKRDRRTAELQHDSFRRRTYELAAQCPESEGLAAVKLFYEKSEQLRVQGDPNWPEAAKIAGCNVTFRLVDALDPVVLEPSLRKLFSRTATAVVSSLGVCLVTGEDGPIQQLHFPIAGASEKPAPLAAINDGSSPAFASFGKHQGFNFPVCESAAFKYSTALNHLLRPGSRQRMQVGDASTVFWAQKSDDADMEGWFAEIFGGSDDPDAHTAQVRALFESIHSGRFDGALGQRAFYVLGLAPNAARLSVRFWHVATLVELAHRMQVWFDDLRIVRDPGDPEFPTLKRLLASVCLATRERPGGDIERLPPAIGGDVMRAILTGGPYPPLWLNAAVQRCRAQRQVSYLRACVIKACLNRSSRTTIHADQAQEFTAMLDPENPSAGYRLGRLFALLERIQEEASPGLNATIRDRYYGAASSTPVAVFTTLLRLKNHHLAKLANRGRAVNFEKLIGEVLDGLGDMPVHLPLRDQGRFALGYYHQRQALFTKAEPTAATPSATTMTGED